MATVGIIANPASGKDIRRLVAQGRFVPNQEKVNILRRVLAGLDAVGVGEVVIMPDIAVLGRGATTGTTLGLEARVLDLPVFNTDRDSTRAAEAMARLGVGCIVTLGGDGTNRAVARASGEVPIVPISTGTNNVFPKMTEGTLAGMAAGVVAEGLVDIEAVTTVHRRIELHLDQELEDIALVDAAVSTEQFVGSRAIWDMDTVHEIFLADAEPASIGLSSIGAILHARSPADSSGTYVVLGPGGITVLAPVAPGKVVPVAVRDWRPLPVGESVEIDLRPCTVALDGERTYSLTVEQVATIRVTDRGPCVVSVEATMREAARNGILRG